MALTGFTRTCSDIAVGGIVTIGLIEKSNVTAITLTDGEISAITYAAAATATKFSKYEFADNEGEYKEDISVGDSGATKVTSQLIFKLGVMSDESRKSIQDLIDNSACGFIAYIKKGTGASQIIGWDDLYGFDKPLKLNAGTATTGKKFDDSQGEEITLQREGIKKAYYTTLTDTDVFAAAE